MPRWQFILWLAAKSKLRTLDLAPYLGKGILCLLCKSHPETNAHLFFDCNYAWNVWSFILEKFGMKLRIRSIYRLLPWIGHKGRFAGFLGKKRCLLLAAAVYFVWQARNISLFEGSSTPWIDTATKAEFYILRAMHLGNLF